METRPFPWTCTRCRQREVYLDKVDYTTTIDHDGRSYTVQVPSLEVPKCRNCGKIVLTDSANRRISEAFRREAGLMTPEEIRAGRIRCRLDQQAFADLLGVAVSTLSRWETGAQIQQRSLNRLMEAYFGSPEVRRVYGRLGGRQNGATQASPIGVAGARRTGGRGSKMKTMTKKVQKSAAEPRSATRRCWALKTTPWPDPSYWPKFLEEGVVAIGWEHLDIDPSRVSLEGLGEALKRAFPGNPAWNPAKEARKIRKFVDMKESDLILMCGGYPANSKTVHVYGFARVTGPFRDHRSAGWPWRFKHDAKIQRVEKDLPKDDVVRALGKGSLMETIHEIDRDGIDRVAELLGVRVEV